MDISFFIKGLIIGIVIAVPVGPVGVLCMHRTLTEGKIHGLISGLGAATADATYGFIAALGLTFVSDFLVGQQIWFRIIGGILLCGLGLKTFLSKTTKRPGSVNGRGLAGNYGSALFLTLINPITIFAFAAVFTGLGLTGLHHSFAGLLTVGVFTGSGIWWVVISSTAGLFREKVSHDNLVWLNKISGAIIITFGLLLLFNMKI